MKERFTKLLNKLLNLFAAMLALSLLILFHIIIFCQIPVDLLMGNKSDFLKWFIAYKYWWHLLLNEFGLISGDKFQETQLAFNNLFKD